jgi:hypothetical protein
MKSDGTSKGTLSLSDIPQKFREYIPRWNQEFAKRMRSARVTGASLFQEDLSALPERASIPVISSLLRLFRSLPLLFQRTARKNSKDKAIAKEDQQI